MAKIKTELPSFEQLFEELEAVVARLEGGSLSLDESLATFQRGMELAEKCGAMLDSADLRIQELVPTEEGDTELVDFEPDEDDAGV